MMWICSRVVIAGPDSQRHVGPTDIVFQLKVELFTTEHSARKFANDNAGYSVWPQHVRHRYRPSASEILGE